MHARYAKTRGVGSRVAGVLSGPPACGAAGIAGARKHSFNDYLYATAALAAPVNGITSKRVKPASRHHCRKSSPV